MYKKENGRIEGSRSRKTVVYTSEPLLRHPRQFFSAIENDLFFSSELAWRFLVRNLKTQYRQSLLGFLWVLAPPMATALTFIYLDHYRIIDVGPLTIPYGIHVSVGTVLWQGFVDALYGSLKLMSSSRAVLTKVRFPREALILASMGEVLFSFVIRITVLVAVLMFWYPMTLPPTVFLAPLSMIPLLALGFMIGLILMPLAVLYRDVERGISLLLLVWFFITPVVYPAPHTWPGVLLNHFNPVAPLLVTARELLTVGSVSQPLGFLCTTGLTFLALLLSWLLFRVALPHLIDRMST